MRATIQDKLDAKMALLRILQPGDTVYLILRHVSASGMQREIGPVVFQHKDGYTYPLFPAYSIATLLGRRQGKRDGVICNGAGMDMGADMVMQLSGILFGDDYALKYQWL